jgi:hypothetical protein
LIKTWDVTFAIGVEDSGDAELLGDDGGDDEVRGVEASTSVVAAAWIASRQGARVRLRSSREKFRWPSGVGCYGLW